MYDAAARDTVIHEFLTRAGWREAARRPLAGDASFRRYERLDGPAGRAILMDAPPPQENVQAFRAVSELLRALGLSAPRIFAADEDAGLLLLEDFGDRSFAALLVEGGNPVPLYALATDTLVALNCAWNPRHASARALPHYDDDLLIGHEASLLPDWYMPAVGLEADRTARAAYTAAWAKALSRAHALPRTLVLRDYFPDNLMHLPERAGVAACGLLDFQDAVIGCCAYDLASLLQDARRDVPEEIETAMIERFLSAFPALDKAQFQAGYTVLAAQRHTKVIGIFTRLAQRDGKPEYLRHMPRLWRLLERCLQDPALRPVKAWLDEHIPAELRVTPPKESLG